MKKNPNSAPTIHSIVLAKISFENLFVPEETLPTAPFQAQFFFGDKDDNYLGEFLATKENCTFSEDTYKKLHDFISSAENDIALSIFKATPMEPEVKKEELDNYDDTFQI